MIRRVENRRLYPPFLAVEPHDVNKKKENFENKKRERDKKDAYLQRKIGVHILAAKRFPLFRVDIGGERETRNGRELDR